MQPLYVSPSAAGKICSFGGVSPPTPIMSAWMVLAHVKLGVDKEYPMRANVDSRNLLCICSLHVSINSICDMYLRTTYLYIQKKRTKSCTYCRTVQILQLHAGNKQCILALEGEIEDCTS